MVISAVVGAVSSNQAAKAQEHAADKASSQEMSMYNTTRNDLMPYQKAGQAALPSLNNLLSGDPTKVQAQLTQLPGYQFALQQGLQGVQNSAAARGLGTSGAALRGAADYTTGLANSTFGDQFNRLMGAASLGENAAAQTGAYGTQTASNVGSNTIGAGNAQAAGILGTSNAITNYLQNAMAAMVAGQGGLYTKPAGTT